MSKRFIHKHGRRLLDNGYNFIPIIPAHAHHKSAGKAPAFRDWQKSDVNLKLVEKWAKEYPVHGIGIHTRFNPAVDIDCTDENVVDQMVEYVTDLVGPAPSRVGNAPKTLLLYATEDPFTKVKSHVWVDEWGDKHAVEILGSGQQFVAFGIHQKTRKPYQWGAESPLDCHADMDLETITLEQARQIIREFDRLAKDAGWEADPKVSAMNGGEEAESWTGGVEVDDEDWLDEDMFKAKWEGTAEELGEILADLPPEDNYDRWIPVLAAIKDAEREPDEFREIAREWSSRSDNYDDNVFDEKWERGSFNRVLGHVASINGIVRRVENIRQETMVQEEVIPDFDNAQTLVDWRLVADRMKETPVFGTVRDVAIESATTAFKRITGLKKIPKSVFDDLAFDFSQFDAPAWLSPWVFNRSTGHFVNKSSLNEVGPYSFNISNARAMRDMGVKKTADKFASEDYPVPMIDGLMYYPAGHGDMPFNTRQPVHGLDGPEYFEYDGKAYLNTFDPKTLPDMPETYSKADLRAIGVVKNFFTVQFPDEKERRYAMDWLAWVINNPTRKVNYALLIVGCEGSGKTIMKKFMTYLLGGRRNVGTVANNVLQKAFTSWAEGHILKVIEELSIPGHRYDVVNILKEPITNESLQTEGKHRDPGEKLNTASYLAFTNERGAIPIGEESRRWLIISSYFQKRSDLLEFRKKNPRFFKSFELAFLRHAGAIRKWFSEWEFKDGFDPEGHAPDDTAAKTVMRDLNTDVFTEAMENAISSGDILGVTSEVIHSKGVSLVLDSIGMRSSAQIVRRLSEMGFHLPGGKRTRVRLMGELGSVYVRNPELWTRDGGEIDMIGIAHELNSHAEKMDYSDQDDDI